MGPEIQMGTTYRKSRKLSHSKESGDLEAFIRKDPDLKYVGGGMDRLGRKSGVGPVVRGRGVV